MKLFGIGSKLLGGVVFSIINNRTFGVKILVENPDGKVILWTKEEVEAFLRS